MLVTYSCGCVGLIVLNEHFIVSFCTRDHSDYEFSLSPANKETAAKDYITMAPEESKELLGKLNKLIYDGYRYRDIVRLLNESGRTDLEAEQDIKRQAEREMYQKAFPDIPLTKWRYWLMRDKGVIRTQDSLIQRAADEFKDWYDVSYSWTMEKVEADGAELNLLQMWTVYPMIPRKSFLV